MKLSASEDKSDSVPWSGRRKSELGLTANIWSRAGSVSVDSICMYKASSWALKWAWLSSNELMATRYKGP